MRQLLKHQLVRFCLVGATSTVLDKCVYYIVLSAYPELRWYLAQSIAFVFGVTNGFFWNRIWTFRDHQHDPLRQQYPRFVATNVVGLILNLLITKAFLMLFTGQLIHVTNPPKFTAIVASLCAVPIVVIWNFTAARLWTFKAPKKSALAPTPQAPQVPPISHP